MNNKNIRKQVKSGIFWTTFFSAIKYIFRFGSSIVLARLLFPEDFGLMGLAMITVQFARRLASFGFTMAIVQRKEVHDDHFHTTFWFNLFLLSMVTVTVYFAAPYMAIFFSNQSLEPVLQVIAFNFILQSFVGVPRSVIVRKMDFKKIGLIDTSKDFVQILASMGFALANYGVWSLVFGVLAGSLVEGILCMFYARWLPKFKFKLWALKDVFSFGLWVNIVTYINYFIKNVDYFFIGKFLDAAQLGYYERAFNLMNLPRKRIQRTINGVLFRTYAKLQDDSERILKYFLKVTTYISLISYPLMIILFFTAPSLITNLYGPKWIPTIYPFQVMCISGLIYTFELTFDPLIMGKGLMRFQALRMFIILIMLASCVFVGIQWGINGVAWGVVIASVLSFTINLQIITSKFKLSVLRYLRAHRSIFIYGIFQVAIILGFQYLMKTVITKDSVLMLVSVVSISVLTLLTSHLLFRFKDISEIMNEFFADTKKILMKAPVINKIKFLT